MPLTRSPQAPNSSTLIASAKADISDPFHSTTLNDLMKPIIAIDRLKVLRRQFEKYFIYLYQSDLKAAGVPKDKIKTIIGDLPQEKLNPPLKQSNMDLEEIQIQTLEANAGQAKRKKRKRSSLTSNRTSSAASNDLVWVNNWEENKIIRTELR